MKSGLMTVVQGPHKGPSYLADLRAAQYPVEITGLMVSGMSSSVIARGDLLTRGELAAQIGCNIETIRYYEQAGLLPPPPRTEGGHRLYGQELVKRLNFVRRSRELGFTLEEIRGLLRLVDGGRYTCAQVEATARDHVREIRRKISDLNKIGKVLEAMAARCSGHKVPECPIIDALYDTRTRLPIRAAPPGRRRRSARS